MRSSRRTRRSTGRPQPPPEAQASFLLAPAEPCETCERGVARRSERAVSRIGSAPPSGAAVPARRGSAGTHHARSLQCAPMIDRDDVAKFQFAGQDLPWLLDLWARTQPDRPVLIWEPKSGKERRWTYREFNDEV